MGNECELTNWHSSVFNVKKLLGTPITNPHYK